MFSLYFENFPYTVLLVSIQFNVLDCSELKTGNARMAVMIALILTFVQVIVTVLTTSIESRWLQESTLSYLMTKMTANNNWIPYIHLITRRKCDININFGDLAIKIPFISHVFGFHKKVLFEFSDNSLIYLLNELKIWSSEVRG